MGGIWSRYKKDSNRNAQMDEADSEPTSTKLVKHPKRKRTPVHITNTPDSDDNMDKKLPLDKYHQVQSLDSIIHGRGAYTKQTLLEGAKSPTELKDYYQQRDEIKSREAALSWDHLCRQAASGPEKEADQILQILRWYDEEITFKKAPSVKGYQGQEHRRFMGDHFLHNVNLINTTKLFRVARAMPKGAHLHIHFNANLLPNVLLDIAVRMPRMFITSDRPLITKDDFDQCRLQFMILSDEAVHQRAINTSMALNPDGSGRKSASGLKQIPADLFNRNYPRFVPLEQQHFRPPMMIKEFMAKFKYPDTGRYQVDGWLREKLMFDANQAHGMLQTPEGAWDLFNGRTQMMKGLFNYKSAYHGYIGACLQEFVNDRISYAELRVNFMHTNQLYSDDGKHVLKNDEIMKIIVEECEAFKVKNKWFAGVKIIYCAPRSFPVKLIKNALDECIKFKQDWPDWIAGFDLVGEEGKGRSLREHAPELLQFKQDCRGKKDRLGRTVDIPFLFHCGETLDVGSDVDGNLYDALLLGAKRIGHGFALARHPYVMEQMKKANVCLELCPISNEILGLTPRAEGHAMYNLLANNVHCTVNTDNGTLFRSRLSHDFYQLFAGKKDMNLFGWKQLAIWSIKHSCMDPQQQDKVLLQWKQDWKQFVDWILHDSENKNILRIWKEWDKQKAEEARRAAEAKMTAEAKKAVEVKRR